MHSRSSRAAFLHTTNTCVVCVFVCDSKCVYWWEREGGGRDYVLNRGAMHSDVGLMKPSSSRVNVIKTKIVRNVMLIRTQRYIDLFTY